MTVTTSESSGLDSACCIPFDNDLNVCDPWHKAGGLCVYRSRLTTPSLKLIMIEWREGELMHRFGPCLSLEIPKRAEIFRLLFCVRHRFILFVQRWAEYLAFYCVNSKINGYGGYTFLRSLAAETSAARNGSEARIFCSAKRLLCALIQN